jgi:exopolyphosphatase/guanosine-5'-triphosphate,3'-diphosphate pyrophosphatase
LRKLGESSVSDDDWPLVAALRFAALFHRSRSDAALPELSLKRRDGAFLLSVPEGWLAENPLTETALREEAKLWRGSGRAFELRRNVDRETGAALVATV